MAATASSQVSGVSAPADSMLPRAYCEGMGSGAAAFSPGKPHPVSCSISSAWEPPATDKPGFLDGRPQWPQGCSGERGKGSLLTCRPGFLLSLTSQHPSQLFSNVPISLTSELSPVSAFHALKEASQGTTNACPCQRQT